AKGDTRRCGYLMMRGCRGDTTATRAWGFNYEEKKCQQETVICGTGGAPRNAFETKQDCDALCEGYSGPQYSMQEMLQHLKENAKKTG
uniref:Monogrin 1 n=1 Tax=Argas monolakensis TaxID=34602 RepID=KUNP1_ARGMO